MELPCGIVLYLGDEDKLTRLADLHGAGPATSNDDIIACLASSSRRSNDQRRLTVVILGGPEDFRNSADQRKPTELFAEAARVGMRVEAGDNLRPWIIRPKFDLR